MDRFSNEVVAAKGEGDIAQSTRRTYPRQVGVDPRNRFDEVDGVVAVLFNTGANGKNIGVENDVAWLDAYLGSQYVIAAFTDLDFTLVGIRLTVFIKCHDHHGRAIGFTAFRYLDERLLTLFQTDRVDDGLTLNAL